MATLLERIEALTGSASSSTEVTQWIQDGVIDVQRRIRQVRPDVLHELGQVATFPSSGLSLGSYAEVLDVNRGSYPSEEVSPKQRFDLDNSTSLYRATNKHPKHYKLNQTVYIKPDPTGTTPGQASVIGMSNATAGDSAISNFPDDLDYAVVLYAALQSLSSKIADAVMPEDLTLSAPTAIGDFIDVSNSLPTYEDVMGVVLPDTLSDTTIDFSNVGDVPVFAAPAMGDLPTLTLSTLPTLTSLDLSSIATPSKPSNPSFSSPSIALGTPPVYTGPTEILTGTTAINLASTYIDTDEDLDQAMTKLEQISASINDFNVKTQDALNEFNEDNVYFQAILTKEIEEAKLTTSKENLEYAGYLQLYQTETQAYASRINAAVQTFQANENTVKLSYWEIVNRTRVEEYRSKSQVILEQFNAELQAAVADHETGLKAWQAQIERYLAEFQAETGYDVSKYRALVEGIIQRHMEDVRNHSTAFDSDLKKYSSELQYVNEYNQRTIGKFQAENQQLQIESGADINNYVAKIQQRQAQLQHWLELYNRLDAKYEQIFVPFKTSK